MGDKVYYRYLTKSPFYQLVHEPAFFLSGYRVNTSSKTCSELEGIKFLQENYPSDYLVCPGYFGKGLVDVQIGVTGGIEKNEGLIACAIRELEEEVCLQIGVDNVHPIPTCNIALHGCITDCVFGSDIGVLGKSGRCYKKSHIFIHGSLSDCKQVIGSQIIEQELLHDNIDRMVLVPINSFEYNLRRNQVYNTILQDPPKTIS